ncbi:opsin-5-like [Tachyglossus aculeatus]|uniref:opsin-5-like n=1 Tax=Tachyglossus aculeatus TaxID=9261 RepID=UPI0018F70A14|nr:opsin-5-like [Tachyglossus aculeatus]
MTLSHSLQVPWRKNLTFLNKEAQVSEQGETIIGIYLLALGWMSWFGNSMVIFILHKQRGILNPTDYLTFNLAVSDASISVFGYSRGIIEIFNVFRDDGFLITSIWTCQVDGFLTLLFGLASINTLAMISVTRYIKGCHPHRVFCYVSIIKVIKSSHALAGATDPSDRQRRLDRDVTRVSIVICTVFTVAWSPYAVISMWSAFGHPVPNLTSVLASLFAKSASFYNPIIYFGMNSKFRRDILVLLPCAKETREPVKLKNFKNLKPKQGFTLQKQEKAHILQVPDSGLVSPINTPPLGNRNALDLACDNSNFECVRL